MNELSYSQVNEMCEESGLMTVEHSFDGQNPVVSRAKALIMVLHDGGMKTLPPQVMQVIDPIYSEVSRWSHAERDVGTIELARAIMEQYNDTIMINVLLPRSKIDMNRQRKHAIVVRHNPENEQEVEAFRALQREYETMYWLLQFFRDRIMADIYLEPHSMAPCDPIGKPENPQISNGHSFSNHVDCWNAGTNPRPTQVFDSVQVWKTIMPLSSGSKRCSRIVRANLLDIDIPSSNNRPFTLKEGLHLSAEVGRTFRNAVIADFRKPDLASEIGGSGLEFFQPDNGKIKIVAGAIAKSFRQIREQRR